MDTREQNLQIWLEEHFNEPVKLKAMTNDASFRRYFRLQHKNQPYIAMDSPPDLEDCKPFVSIANAYADINLEVPKILAADTDNGYLLISDLGDQLFYHHLENDNVDTVYQAAIDDLLTIQSCTQASNKSLPHFDWDAMRCELDFFTEWFLEKYLKISISGEIQTLLNTTYEILLQSAVDQPQVGVHRDYHSRNLMLLPNQRVGILDFQDAVIGPITYDLVSLIRDCYIDWPQEKVEAWALNFRQQLLDHQRIDNISEQMFLRWFDLMGMQRHLKAIFIFARKQLRDDNDHYLMYIPRVLNYVKMISEKYIELNPFYEFLTKTIMPAWDKHQPT